MHYNNGFLQISTYLTNQQAYLILFLVYEQYSLELLFKNLFVYECHFGCALRIPFAQLPVKGSYYETDVRFSWISIAKIRLFWYRSACHLHRYHWPSPKRSILPISIKDFPSSVNSRAASIQVNTVYGFDSYCFRNILCGILCSIQHNGSFLSNYIFLYCKCVESFCRHEACHVM